MKQYALLAVIAASCWSATRPAAGAVENIADGGEPIMGIGIDLIGSDDVTIANAGPINEIVDGVLNGNFTPNAFIINGNGSTGAAGNGVDTFAGSLGISS